MSPSVRLHALPIRTPEGVEFALPLAGPVSRLMAMIVDLMVVGGISKVAEMAITPLAGLNVDIARGLLAVLYFLITFMYGILCEWLLQGQTLGKRMFRLRVVDASGLRLAVSQIVIRNLLRLVDTLPMFYLVGGATALLNAKMQRLGDIAASTVVVSVPSVAQPDLDQILGSKYNSLLEHRHLCARLRQRISPDLAALALQALIRRESFDASSRLAVFADLATHFRNAVEFPPEVTESLADEQYVRNVVEALYRR